MSPRQLIIKLLDRFESSNAYADIILETELREQKLSEKNKGLIQEIFFGIIRWRNHLDWIIKKIYQGQLQKTPRFIRYILQIGLYQLIFMNRIPEYAAINEAVELAKIKGGTYWGKKVNAILRSYQRGKPNIDFPQLASNPVEFIAVYYSHPEWIIKRWIDRFGVDNTILLCEANNKTPLLSLRVNTIKISVQELQNRLAQFDVLTSQSTYLKNFIQAQSLPDLSQFRVFQEGMFSIQDASAGLACVLLNPQPGDKIVDLCAAPGGKTTFLAELTKDEADIFAVDANLQRLNLIRQNLNRLKLKSVQLVQADGTQYSSQKVDKAIVDAPCSGLGVLSKRIDLRWKRIPDQLEELSELQLKLLQNAAKLVKPGGVIVYCTCTIEPEENEQIIDKFLIENKDFRLEPASKFVSKVLTTSEGFVYTFPHRHGIDGSFAARLIKL